MNHDYFGNACGTKHWNDFERPEELQNLLVNGVTNTRLINEVSKNSVHIDRVESNKRTKFFNDVQGFSPIVPLVIMGVPKNMSNSRTVKMKNKVINLVWDCSISGGTETSDVRAVAIEVLKQVVGLELAGYRVRLTAVDSYCSGGISYMMGLTLKKESQPINLKRILFPCTSSAFVRGVSFGWYVRLPDAEYISGYGRTAHHEYREHAKDYYEQIFGTNTISFSIAEFLDAKRRGRLESTVKARLTVKEGATA